MILFIDTETTGLPSRYAPVGSQPYMVQVAAVLCDDERNELARLVHLIRPEGWDIPVEATAIHGFTTGYCRQHGVPLSVAMKDVLELWDRANRIVAYNVAFDHTILSYSAQRVNALLPQRELYCAMRQCAKLLSDNGRWLKLQVAYECLFGRSFENAHDAATDLEACKAIYYALADALAPVSRLVGDTGAMSARSLKKAIAGANEVEEHERLVHSLIELHRASLEPVRWRDIATQPDPAPPEVINAAETVALMRLRSYRPTWFERLFKLDLQHREQLKANVEKAKARDHRENENALAAYNGQRSAMAQSRRIARHVLRGDIAAYEEVMDEIDLCASPLLGRQVIYSFQDAASVEVYAYLNSAEIIPDKMKALLASGRVSVKKRAKRDFALLYEDHVCSAVLRIGRDFFARLPVEKVLLHGFVTQTEGATGLPTDTCIVSCLMDRKSVKGINFDLVDPSECVMSFPASIKKTRGLLVEVLPMTMDGNPAKKPGKGKR